MVCESACLLVYVTKMYLHNRRRTLEDLKKKKTSHSNSHEHQAGRFSSSVVCKQFRRLCPNDSTEKHLISFLMNHFQEVILTWFSTYDMCGLCYVLQRNTLCQTSATFTPYKDSPKECSSFKDLWTVEKWRISVWFKGHRRFDCHTHLGQFNIYNHCGSRAILGLHVNG